MKFEKTDKLYALSKKYNFDKQELINWFILAKKRKGMPFDYFYQDGGAGCSMINTADEYLCIIMIHNENTCTNCIFSKRNTNHNASIEILDNLKRIIEQ